MTPRLRARTGFVEAILGGVAIAWILGVVGPSLDAPTRTYASYGYTPPQAASRTNEQDAHEACARAYGDNAGYVIAADGAVVCTDKHGHRPRHSQITIAVKTEVRP